MKKKKVLILLATYNGEKFINLQLQTILDQSHVDIEILISDDNSTDNTLLIIKRFTKLKKKIKIINNPIKFGSASQNFFNLIINSKVNNFDYIAFADQDDIWMKDKLITAIKTIKKKQADGLSSDVIAYWPDNKKKRLIKKSIPQLEYDHWFEGPGPGCTHVMTKNAFKVFKNFIIQNTVNLKKIKSHDWLIYTFLRYKKFRWIISNKPKMFYVQHANNDQGANHGILAKLIRIKKIQKSWYKSEIYNIFKIITGKNFDNFIKLENLKFKPLSLRRKKSESLFVWLLILFGFL